MGKLGKFTTNRQQRREKFYYRPIFIPAPASTRSCWPVTNRDSSEDRYTTACEMSAGSTHGVGIACMNGNVTAASSAVGFSRSGRNVRYIGMLCNMSVFTLVG